MPRFRFCVVCLTILVTQVAPAFAGPVPVVPLQRTAFAVTDQNNLYRLDFASGTAIPLESDSVQRTALRDLLVRDLELGPRQQVDLVDLLTFDDRGPGEAQLLRFLRNPTNGLWEGSDVLPGSLFTAPDGLSLAGNGALFFVDNTSPPKVLLLPPDPTELPAGDGFAPTPIPVDEKPPCDLLSDTQVVKYQGAGFSLGDLLVLCQEPPLVLRYRQGKPCQDPGACSSLERRVLLDQSDLPATEMPTSLAFTPDGDLLLASFDQMKGEGRILRFFVDGGTIDVKPFVKKLFAAGPARMVGGVQEGSNGLLGPFLFYANQGEGGVYRYAPQIQDGVVVGGELDPDPATIQNPILFGGELPTGVAIGTSRAAPTRTGNGSRIRPRASLLATFDRVLVPGLTEARLFVFPDIRGSEPGPLYLCAPGSPSCSTPDGVPFVPLGLPNVIPSYVRPLAVKSSVPLVGRGLSQNHPFVLFDIASTAGFEETVRLQALEEQLLGEDILHCDEAAVATGELIDQLPVFFHGADLDDPPVVDGSPIVPTTGKEELGGFGFFPVPSGCGSNFGRTQAFSNFLVGRLDVRSFPIDQQLPLLFQAALPAVQGLRRALDPQTDEADGGLARFLPEIGDEVLVLAEQALELVLGQDAQGAIGALEDLLKTVRTNGGGVDNSTRNVSGELKVRATAAILLLCGGTNCSQATDKPDLIFEDTFDSGDTQRWSSTRP